MGDIDEQSNTELWLVMFLGESLALAFPTREPLQTFRLGQRVFRAGSPGAVGAFYDRLTDPEGRLVGIRIAPVMEQQVPVNLARMPRRAYLAPSADGSWIDVYLAPGLLQSAESQGDQAFGGRIYVSDDGEVAVSLDLGYLAASSDDIEAVRAASARSVEILLPSDTSA